MVLIVIPSKRSAKVDLRRNFVSPAKAPGGAKCAPDVQRTKRPCHSQTLLAGARPHGFAFNI